MAEVRGFRGVRYRLEAPDEAGPLTCPPYDVISPEQAAALREAHPHNFVRLELPDPGPAETESDNRYTRAAALYREWLARGVLQREQEPALYVYGQRYRVEGREQERLGLVGALKVEPYEAGVVLPHEQTFPKHKEDRFRLLSAARAQFSPIFGLYSAPGVAVRPRLEQETVAPPAAVARDREGVEHRLWPVANPEFAAWASRLFAERTVYIADGHHRYETALRYAETRRREDPSAPLSWFDQVMIFLVEMSDPGLVLLPTHRLLKGPLPSGEVLAERLAPAFQVRRVSPEQAADVGHHQLGLVHSDGSAFVLTLSDPRRMEQAAPERSAAWRDLDVAILHRLVMGELLGLPDEASYTRDAREAVRRTLSGEFAAAFLMPPPQVAELEAVVAAGEKMPQKSTFFWPKAISGLVVHGEE